MNVVYSWLKDFVDIDVPAEELADALTAAGLEVASITRHSVPAGIKVATVLETQKHPNADKLTLCKVDSGSGILDIVCGAPNVRTGIKVSLATIGTVIAHDFIITKSTIRGSESFGMLCSERELGLSDKHEGIMELPADFVVGHDLSFYYPEDVVIEIEITPDRGDCLSMIGVAREVTARYGLPLKETVPPVIEHDTKATSDYVSVSIESPELCPRYCGRFVQGVTIKPSPQWMQRRLTLAGIRPINNVVDVTNYILLHFGQPMHAFDYSKIDGKRIVVKKAGCQQQFTTLDDNERKLIAEDLLINDGSKPVALAGIMGGTGSQILDSTNDIFLECAFFDPVAIRKTSKRLGLSTDSSYRFERGVDPDNGITNAINYAAELIRQTAGGTIAKGTLDIYPKPFTPRIIMIRPQRASKILGTHFSDEQVRSFLVSLEIKCSDEDGAIRCEIPLFRHDLTIEEDLIEEVGRLYGYDNIVPSDSATISLNTPLPTVEKTTDQFREALAFAGLREITTNSMTSEKLRALLTPEKKPVSILNPLTPDMAQMRTTLVGSMLEVLVYNINHKNVDNHFFEIGKTFEYTTSGEVRERHVLGILIQGNYFPKTWNTIPVPADFYVLKGILDAFAAHTSTGPLTYDSPGQTLALFSHVQTIISAINISGVAGQIAKSILDHFDIKSTIFFAELDITDQLSVNRVQPHYLSLARYPAVERDFSFVMPDTLSVSTISREIYEVSPLIEEVYPFDLYKGDKLGTGKKSITFSVKIRSPEKTLTDKEAEGICTSIVNGIQEKFTISLRS